MRIIDTHVHIFPEKIAAAAVQATSQFYLGAISPEMRVIPDTFSDLGGTAADLTERLARAGIDRAVVFSTATKPQQVESINNFIAAACKQYPQLIGVGTMHIDYPDFGGELRRMKELGLVGVKLHPDIQRFALDDDRLLPLYDQMRAENMFLIAHTGDFRFDYSSPVKMARLAKLFPELRFVGAHFGGWSEWEAARECLDLPNVYVDTSSTMSFGGWAAAKKAFDAFDPTHIFFATDYPMWDPGEELERFRKLGLDDDLARMVLAENFENFLQL